MREKEHWKDYLIPFLWGAGLLMVMVSVALFGRLAAEHDNRQLAVMHGVTTDFLTTPSESIDNSHDPFAAESGVVESDEDAHQTETPKVTKKSDLLEKPENIENTLEFDKWERRFWSLLPFSTEKINPGDVPQLLEEISEIRESDGAIYYFSLGHIYHQLLWHPQAADLHGEYYTKAVENLDKAIELNDGIAAYNHFRGLIDYGFAVQSGKPEYFSSAIPHFVKAEQLAPGWIITVAMQGRCAFDLGKYRESVALLERVAKVDPSCWEATTLLPRAHNKLEQMVGFFDFLDSDLPLDFTGQSVVWRIKKPETIDSRELDRWNNACLEIIGRAGLRRPEEVPELVTQWTGLTKEDGKFYHYVCGYIHDHLSRRRKEFRLSHYTRAVEYYTKAIELDDSVAVFHHLRGQVDYFYAENENSPKHYEKALENYIEAERRDATWSKPPIMQGRALLALQRYDEAIASFERAVRIDGERVDAMQGIVQAIAKKSELDQKNIELLKQGLDWVERWHRTIVHWNNQNDLRNGTAFAERFIARWKDLETISPVDYPNCFTLDELISLANFRLIFTVPKDALLVYERIMTGEVSPYFYQEFRNPPENKFSSKTQEERVLYNIAYAHFKLGDYEKALAASETFRETAGNIDWSVGSTNYVDAPNVHFITIKSLSHLERYEEIIDYYISGKITLEQLIEWGRYHREYRPIFIDIALAMHKIGQTKQMIDFVALFEPLPNNPNVSVLSIYARESHQSPEPGIVLFIQIYAEALYQKAILGEDFDRTIARLCHLLDCLIGFDSDFHPYYKKLGDLFFERERYGSAVGHYEHYLKYAPYETDVLEHLWQSYEILKNAKEAVRIGTIFIMLYPDNPDYWIRRARLQHRYFDSDQLIRGALSINDMTKAIELLERDSGTDKKRLAQVYLWRGDMLCSHDRLYHATMDYRKTIELTAGPPLSDVTFENAKGDKTVYPYQELISKLLRCYWNNRHQIETPVSELCTDFILQGGDEFFLIAARAEARRLEGGGESLKNVDDYLVLLKFIDVEKHGRVDDSWLNKDYIHARLTSCYQSLSIRHPKNKEYFDKAVEHCTQLTEKYPENEVAYDWLSSVYRAQVEKNNLLTEEEREHYKKLQEESTKKIHEIREREAAKYD